MSWPERTRHFLFFVLILVLTYDAIAIYYGGPPASVSWVLRKLAYEHTIIAILAGMVIGHIFWFE